MDFHPEVPAQVHYETTVQTGIVVTGGSNWDFSRSAIATPIAPAGSGEPGGRSGTAYVTTYAPSHRMPSRAPDIVVNFKANSAALNSEATAKLKDVPRGVTVVLAGHADPDEKNPQKIAKQRAAAVSAFLKKRGRGVEAAKSFGGVLPLGTSALEAPENRRVEVFLGN